MTQIRIRCYAKKQGNLWIAICVDLCLASQDYTSEGAIEKLNAQIDDYLKEAFSDRRFTKQLLSRKAPLLQRLEYHYCLFVISIARLILRSKKPEEKGEQKVWDVTNPVCA